MLSASISEDGIFSLTLIIIGYYGFYSTPGLDKWAEQDLLEDDFFKEIRGSDQLPGSSKKCLKQKYCTKTKDGTRIVKMYPYEKERTVMNEKMQTPEAKEIFKLRKQIVEPVFVDIKENKGITSVLTRGLKTVKTEFNLISTANNISRMHRKRKEIIQGNNFITIFLFRRFTLIYSIFNCRTACKARGIQI